MQLMLIVIIFLMKFKEELNMELLLLKEEMNSIEKEEFYLNKDVLLIVCLLNL